ncbi:MAG: transporter [Calditrichaeota bacterium]|nr:transporter [Calditrichota bacterium]
MKFRGLKNIFTIALMLLLWLLPAQMAVGAGKWSLFSYLSYYSGRYYLTETTRSLYVAGGLRYRSDRWNVSFSMPWIIQNSNLVQQTGNVFYPMGPDGNGRSHMDGDAMGMGDGWHSRHMNFQAPTSHILTGLGDAYGYISYRLYGGGFATYAVFANIQIKAPTASVQRGFGTGEWDYGGSFSFQKLFWRKWGAIVELGILDIGDPDSITFKNPVFGSLTLNWFVNPKVALTLYYLWYTQIQDQVEPPRYVNGGVHYQMSNTITLLVTVGRGMSSSSADFNMFTSLEVTL